MEISPIGYSPRPQDLLNRTPATRQQPDQFVEMLGNALQGVNDSQQQADNLANQVALGKDVEIHDAVLATEEANLSFQYTMQIRNKLIEAYQEIMRMQI